MISDNSHGCSGTSSRENQTDFDGRNDALDSGRGMKMVFLTLGQHESKRGPFLRGGLRVNYEQEDPNKLSIQIKLGGGT